MKLYTEEQVRSLLNKMDIIYSLEDLTPVDIYLKGISFPMRLMKKSFKNEDDSVGILYLITNDLKKQIIGCQACCPICGMKCSK